MYENKNISITPICKEAGDRYVGWKAWIIEENVNKLIIKCMGRNVFHYISALIIITLAGFMGLKFPISNINVFVVLFLLVTYLADIIWFVFDRLYVRKGNWLLCDFEKKRLLLPRIEKAVQKENVLFFQVIIGLPGIAESRYFTQINLVVNQQSTGYVRYPLMRAISPKLVLPLIYKVSNMLKIDIQRVEYSIAGKVVRNDIEKCELRN